jgi:hypothetical protein
MQLCLELSKINVNVKVSTMCILHYYRPANLGLPHKDNQTHVDIVGPLTFKNLSQDVAFVRKQLFQNFRSLYRNSYRRYASY